MKNSLKSPAFLDRLWYNIIIEIKSNQYGMEVNNEHKGRNKKDRRK